MQSYQVARFGFTSNKAISPTSASAPATGGIKCVSVVSICTPRTLTGFPGVLKVRPEYANTTTPKVTKMTAMMVFEFIQGFSGGVVFLDSSVLVTVPSFDSVTVFSVDFTVPSLLTLVLSVRETSRSQPTSRGKTKAAIAKHITVIRFISFSFMRPS